MTGFDSKRLFIKASCFIQTPRPMLLQAFFDEITDHALFLLVGRDSTESA